MTSEIVSANVFHWALIALTGGLAGSWLVYDTVNLVRIRRADPGDALAGDKRFGYIIGMLIGITGVVGCVLYHLQFVG